MVSAAARKMLVRHIEAERIRDLDGVLATLSATPVYLVPGYRLEGREALRAMYTGALVRIQDGNSDEYLNALEDPEVAYWGERHCVLDYSDKYPLHRGMSVVIIWDGDHIKSEHTFFSIAKTFNAAATMRDAAFRAIPGVIALE